jgi:alkaline phosphatase
MKNVISGAFLLFMAVPGFAQDYTSASIFAHNDYVQSNPFHDAYNLRVGYIEADVFLHDGELVVAHTRLEIKKGKTVDVLYLKPLSERIRANSGSAYPASGQMLALMIDLKTEGVSTLNKLVENLRQFPALLSCQTLQIMISGSVPDPELWKNYPDFIHFDGRPFVDYTDDQLSRVSMISTSFRDHSKWNGKGPMPQKDKEKIESLIQAVHAKGKPVRFWATPDFPEAWQALMNLKMDVIVSDNVKGLAEYIELRSK